MSSLTYIRKVFHATVLSIILVGVITIIVIFFIAATKKDGSCTNDDLGTVDDVTVEIQEDNTLRVSWTYNTTCNVVYSIRHVVKGVSSDDVLVRDKHVTLTTNTCTDNEVSVTVRTLTGQVGGVATKNVKVGHDAMGYVQNLIYEHGRFTWEKPVDAEHCDLSYDVIFENELDKHTGRIVTTHFDFDLHPCSTNTIRVTPVFLDDLGDDASTRHTEDRSMNAPVHVWTDPETSSATAVWKLERPVDNLCEVREISIEIGSEKFIFDLDAETNKAIVNITELNENTIYSYTARWVLGDGVYSEMSEMSFKTVTLTKPTIQSDPQSYGFRITWNQEYDSEFVKGHRIVVTSHGPKHFVPDGCDVEDGVVYIKDVEQEEKEFNYEDARPSHIYTIDLYTIFTVGLERTQRHTLTTLEAEPGPLVIIPTLSYDDGVPYDVSAVVNWSVPCDVNGDLTHFSYTFNGSLNTESFACDDLQEGDVAVNPDRETYSVDVDYLLPFFNYEITIQMHLVKHSSVSTQDFLSPNGYAPPPDGTQT